MSKDEQIVATVPKLEMAETLRRSLMERGRQVGPKVVVYIFHGGEYGDSYHLGVANEFQSRLSEDDVLDMMDYITEFHREAIEEAERFSKDPDEGLERLAAAIAGG